jgi:hypothetical protein
MKWKKTAEKLFDVLAVDFNTKKVRIMAKGKTVGAAEAIVNMAIMRQGVDVEYFTICREGKYTEGSVYDGN